MNICPVCEAFIRDTTIRQRCQNCGNGDRTRNLAVLYRKMLPFTRSRNALIFSTESWLSDSCFESAERSVFGGANHLDIQSIDKESGSFGWVVANHVLEHVEHDLNALEEMLRVAGQTGVVQITVPTPNATAKTNDWGHPDPNNDGHYRNYGSDFLNRLRSLESSPNILCVFARDPVSPFEDIVYFLSQDQASLDELATVLFKDKTVSLPIYN